MPQRSAVSRLPDDVRQELERRLIANGFSDYEGLAEWLQSQGFDITRSSVHRFGQPFERRLESLKVATDQAKAIAEASADDEGAMNEALIRLVQTKTFEILRVLEEGDVPQNLPKLGRMVADLARASINQKKWADQIRRQEREAAADVAGEAAQRAGLSDDGVAAMRQAILAGL